MPEALAYSVGDAAEVAGVGRSFFYNEIRAGRLIARKAKGRTLILHPDLVDYLSRLPRLAPVSPDQAAA